MLDFLWNIDLTVFKFINQTLSYPWLDQLTPWLTDLNETLAFKIIVPLLFIFLFVRKYKRAGVTYFIFLILSLSVSDFVGGKIKKVVLRPRPFQVAEAQTIQKAEAKANRSFYSNHSSNMFTLATYTSYFFPAGKAALYGLATVIALTRVHTGVHFPSDILTGALMGCLWGFLFSRLVQFIVNKSGYGKTAG